MSEPEHHGASFYLGVGMAVAGNTLIACSLTLQKHVHNKKTALKPVGKDPLFYFALGGMIAGEVGNFAAFGFASPTVISPLGAVSVIANAILAVVFLAWCFFRTPDIAHGWDYLTTLLQTSAPLSRAFPLALYLDAHLMTVLAIACLSVTKAPERLWQSTRSWPKTAELSLQWTRSVTLVFTLALCAMSISASTHNPFTYFRF